jgi:hypothetical protein
VVPLSFNNQFAHFIFRNKPLNKVAYNPVIACFLIAGVILLSVSIYMFVAMGSVSQVSVKYATAQGPTCTGSNSCTITFSLPSTMKAPVYLLYRLDDFYQNHRRYVQSKSNAQLLGQTISTSDAQICSPFVTNSDMKVTKSWAGVTLDPNAIASPCGAIAYTFYNDTFSLSFNGNNIPIDQGGITWTNDVYGKFRRASNSNLTQWIDPQNEHFINWMRIAGLPNFNKIWGKIQQNLSPGSYVMTINNNFNLKEWSGNKYFILSTNSSAGGPNYLLPIQLLLVGLVCFVAVFYLRKISL